MIFSFSYNSQALLDKFLLIAQLSSGYAVFFYSNRRHIFMFLMVLTP